MLTYKKNDSLMPTFRGFDVFQKVGEGAFILSFLIFFRNSFLCVSNGRVSIHSLLFSFISACSDKSNLSSILYILQRKCGRLSDDYKV